MQAVQPMQRPSSRDGPPSRARSAAVGQANRQRRQERQRPLSIVSAPGRAASSRPAGIGAQVDRGPDARAAADARVDLEQVAVAADVGEAQPCPEAHLPRLFGGRGPARLHGQLDVGDPRPLVAHLEVQPLPVQAGPHAARPGVDDHVHLRLVGGDHRPAQGPGVHADPRQVVLEQPGRDARGVEIPARDPAAHGDHAPSTSCSDRAVASSPVVETRSAVPARLRSLAELRAGRDAADQADARHVHELGHPGKLRVVEGGHDQRLCRGVADEVAHRGSGVDAGDFRVLVPAAGQQAGFDGMGEILEFHPVGSAVEVEIATSMPFVKELTTEGEESTASRSTNEGCYLSMNQGIASGLNSPASCPDSCGGWAGTSDLSLNQLT